MTEEDVVPQDQRHGITVDERLSHQKGIGNAAGLGLGSVFHLQPQLAAVAEKALKAGKVTGGGDNQNPADSRQHEDAERVVDHGFVVDGQQLFADGLSQRKQACPVPSGQNNAFHW